MHAPIFHWWTTPETIANATNCGTCSRKKQTFIDPNSLKRIHAEATNVKRIEWAILHRTPAFLETLFECFGNKRALMNDQIQATRLFKAGKRAIQSVLPQHLVDHCHDQTETLAVAPAQRSKWKSQVLLRKRDVVEFNKAAFHHRLLLSVQLRSTLESVLLSSGSRRGSPSFQWRPFPGKVRRFFVDLLRLSCLDADRISACSHRDSVQQKT